MPIGRGRNRAVEASAAADGAAAPVKQQPDGVPAAAAKVVSIDGDVAAGPVAEGTEAELDAIYRRVALAICPFFAAVTAVSALDRSNLSYASISLIPTLKLSPSAYGETSALVFSKQQFNCSCHSESPFRSCAGALPQLSA